MPGSPLRLAYAVLVAVEHLRSNTIVETVCPISQQVGGRPLLHHRERMGTKCEPWLVRGMQMILDQYLDPSMRGLEWSAGSSSLWALRRLQRLYSVEHDGNWAAFLQSTLRKQLPHLAPKWTLAIVPGKDGGHGTNYTEYVNTVGAHWAAEYPFDYVLVDGMDRTRCLAQVLHEQPEMLSPQYGVLVLDNSERHYKEDVPKHWLCVSLRAHAPMHTIDETTLWMRCPSTKDAECAAARHMIQDALRQLPTTGALNHTLGSRCGHAASTDPREERSAHVSHDTSRLAVRQGLVGQSRKESPVGILHRDPFFWGQGMEDRLVFEKFFSSHGLQPHVKRGQFVEMGALNGMKMSNTRFFQQELQWGGLLIEANPTLFRQLRSSPRCANATNTICVQAAVCRGGSMQFRASGPTGGDARRVKRGNDSPGNHEGLLNLPCKPLSQLLKDAAIQAIDFFSLDVEGSELSVLQTMDWTIPISVLLVELQRTNNDSHQIRELLRTNNMIQYASKVGFGQSNDIWIGRDFHELHPATPLKLSERNLYSYQLPNATARNDFINQQDCHDRQRWPSEALLPPTGVERASYYLGTHLGNYTNGLMMKWGVEHRFKYQIDNICEIPVGEGLQGRVGLFTCGQALCKLEEGGNFYIEELGNICRHGKAGSTMAVLLGDKSMPTKSARRVLGGVPVGAKTRYISGSYQVALLPLEVLRHWSPVKQALTLAGAMPWEQKQPSLVWRGSPSGMVQTIRLTHVQVLRDLGHDVRFSVKSRWLDDPRHACTENGSSIQEVTFTNGYQINCSLFGSPLGMEDMMRHRYLLSLPGNDVASNLKWALASGSVVVMPPPLKESWLMEGLLKPWIHYAPLYNPSEVNDVLWWLNNHEEQARIIASNGQAWVCAIMCSDWSEDVRAVLEGTMSEMRAD